MISCQTIPFLVVFGTENPNVKMNTFNSSSMPAIILYKYTYLMALQHPFEIVGLLPMRNGYTTQCKVHRDHSIHIEMTLSKNP